MVRNCAWHDRGGVELERHPNLHGKNLGKPLGPIPSPLPLCRLAASRLLILWRRNSLRASSLFGLTRDLFGAPRQSSRGFHREHVHRLASKVSNNSDGASLFTEPTIFWSAVGSAIKNNRGDLGPRMWNAQVAQALQVMLLHGAQKS